MSITKGNMEETIGFLGGVGGGHGFLQGLGWKWDFPYGSSLLPEIRPWAHGSESGSPSNGENNENGHTRYPVNRPF